MGTVHKSYVFAVVFFGSVVVGSANVQAQVGACCRPGAVCEDGVDAVVCLEVGGQPLTGESCDQITCQDCEIDLDCDDGLPCSADRCMNNVCRNDPIVGACDDGDPCTVNDVCDGRDCIGDIPSLLFDNYPAASLGQALLSPSPGNLTVSNIGTTGTDGVAICFGGNPSTQPSVAGARWLTMVLPGSTAGITPPPKQKVGAKGEETASNLAGVFPAELIGAEFEQNKVGDFDVSALFGAVGATTTRVEMFLDHNLFNSVVALPTSSPVAAVSELPTALHVGWIRHADTVYFGVVARFATPVTITIPGSLAGVFEIDELRLIPEDPGFLPATFKRFELLATSIPTFTLIGVIDRLPAIIPAMGTVGIFVFGLLTVLAGAVIVRRRSRTSS